MSKFSEPKVCIWLCKKGDGQKKKKNQSCSEFDSTHFCILSFFFFFFFLGTCNFVPFIGKSNLSVWFCSKKKWLKNAYNHSKNWTFLGLVHQCSCQRICLLAKWDWAECERPHQKYFFCKVGRYETTCTKRNCLLAKWVWAVHDCPHQKNFFLQSCLELNSKHFILRQFFWVRYGPPAPKVIAF